MISTFVTTISQLGGAQYGTDSVAFGQYSADLVLQGINPFNHDLASSILAHHVPVIYVTHYLSGSPVASASYPAGSFLFYLPALALGWHTQAAVVIDVIFWVISMLLMWALLPKSIRWLAALLLASSAYLTSLLVGVTDSLYLPFLILALWSWDRYGDRTERSIARWIGPIAFGVAMSVKQTPWFLFPFLAVGVAFEAHRRGQSWFRYSARYAGVCLSVFLAINAPWLVADPGAWFRGSITPLVASFVPIGHGLINLTLIDRLGGGDLRFYTLAGAAWVGMSLLLMALRYGRTKRVWMFLVIASFFFVPRSLGNYFLMLMPAAIIAALTVRDTTDDGPLVESAVVRTLRIPVLVGAALLVAVGLFGAVASPAPLKLTVTEVVTNGPKGLITDATVQIHNTTGRTLQPTFTVNEGGSITNFWVPVGTGRTRMMIGPHRSETVTLQAPDFASMPDVQSPFQVLSYTSGPAAVSSSNVYTTSGQSLYLKPDAIDIPVAVGKKVVFTAQLHDGLGRAVHRGGVTVDLGQTTYTEQGLLGGTASLDGQPEGASPVSATTDAGGVATFTVTGLQTAANPDYFQAWMPPSSPNLPPTGYSEIVALRFRP